MTDSFTLRGSDMLWNDLDGQVVGLDLKTSTYLSLNDVGGALWHRLAEGASFDDLVGAVVAEFDVDRARAAADVARFIDDLGRRGLLEAAPR